MIRISVLLLVLANSAFAGGDARSASLKQLKLRNTHYYVVLESIYAKYPNEAEIRDMDGKVLANVSKKFKAAVDIEGTGRLRDERIINYAGRIGGDIRYLVTSAKWGYGVGHCLLKPWRSVAIDPKVVRLGSQLYIAETDGMELPDGSIHDGMWLADDVGGAIRGDRIDLFVGDGNRGDILDKAHIANMSALTVTVLKGPGADSCVKRPATR